MEVAWKNLPETVAGRRLTHNVRGSDISELGYLSFALEQISQAAWPSDRKVSELPLFEIEQTCPTEKTACDKF